MHNRQISIYSSRMSADDWRYLEQHPDFEFYKIIKYTKDTMINEIPSGDIISFKNNISFIKDIKHLPQNFSQDILIGSSLYDELVKNNKANEMIELEGYKYNIIGTVQSSFDYYISYETFKQHYVPNKIVIYLTKDSLINYNRLTGELSQRFLTTIDSLLINMEKWHISGALTIIIIGCSLMILNEIFLYIFLVKRRQKEFQIYTILGLTYKQKLAYYNFELLLFSSITFLFNTLIWSIIPHINGLLPLLPYIFVIDMILNVLILNGILLFTFRRKAL